MLTREVTQSPKRRVVGVVPAPETGFKILHVTNWVPGACRWGHIARCSYMLECTEMREHERWGSGTCGLQLRVSRRGHAVRPVEVLIRNGRVAIRLLVETATAQLLVTAGAIQSRQIDRLHVERVNCKNPRVSRLWTQMHMFIACYKSCVFSWFSTWRNIEIAYNYSLKT